MQSRTKQIAISAMFAALAIGIYGLESMIPNPIPIPGIKLGLANIITLIVLKKYGLKESALVLAVRILLSSLLFGQLMSLLYSAVGGALCLIAEYLVDKFLRGKALFITAIFGAILHNVGQLLVAVIITSLPGVLIYTPYLMISAVITGFVTGLAALFSLKLLKKL
ncbi:MAG: Gx transporter family protein [Lachnospiraceae bacterium]|nr:Gx transporter family protein [Lachnospiraceae bacterium]